MSSEGGRVVGGAARVWAAPLLLGVAGWAGTTLVAVRLPVSPSWDQMHQIWSVAAFQAGEVPAPNLWARVDLADVERPSREWIWSWPPGIPTLIAALEEAGWSRAGACRLLGSAAGLVGVLGWLVWFQRLDLDPRWLSGVALVLPFLPWAWSGSIGFTADVFAFALTPILLGAALAASEPDASVRRRVAAAALAGLVCTVGYTLKYSIALPAAGAFVFLLLQARSVRPRAALLVVLVAGALALPGPLVTTWLNQRYSGNLSVLDLGPVDGLRADEILALAGSLPFALFDSAPVWYHAFPDTLRGRFEYSRRATPAMFLAGIPGTLVALVLARYARIDDRARRLLAALAATYLAAFLWMFRGHGVWAEVRHFLPLGFALLPAVLIGLRSAWSSGTAARRALLATFVGIYALPALPGAVWLLAARAEEISAPSHAENGLHNPYLTAPVAAKLRGDFARRCGDAGCRWVVPEPWSGVQLSPRFAVVSFEFTPAEELARLRLDQERDVEIWALLFKDGELARRGAVFRRTWADESAWQRRTDAGREYELWTLAPTVTTRRPPGEGATR